MKLFRTTVILYQELFNFELPSVQLERRCKKIVNKFMVFYLVKFAF